MLADAGVIALVPVISPYRVGRRRCRDIHVAAELPFVEVWSRRRSESRTARPKGLYVKARAGELRNFTGIDDAYEPPEAPELVLPTQELTVVAAVELVLQHL